MFFRDKTIVHLVLQWRKGNENSLDLTSIGLVEVEIITHRNCSRFLANLSTKVLKSSLIWQMFALALQMLTEQEPVSVPTDSKYVQFSLVLEPQRMVTAREGRMENCVCRKTFPD